MSEKRPTTIQPVHRNGYIILKRVYTDTFEDVYRNANNTRSYQVFLVGIGWEDTYISAGTRPVYNTYEENWTNFRLDITREAKSFGDEIIEWKRVYADSLAEVRDAFDINDTNYLSGEKAFNREKFFAAKRKAA